MYLLSKVVILSTFGSNFLILENNIFKDDSVIDFQVPLYLLDEEREIEYLGKITDILILFLLPTSYSSCIGTRATLREILSRNVFHVAIDMLTNPRTINKSILVWISNLYRTDVNDSNTLINRVILIVQFS